MFIKAQIKTHIISWLGKVLVPALTDKGEFFILIPFLGCLALAAAWCFIYLKAQLNLQLWGYVCDFGDTLLHSAWHDSRCITKDFILKETFTIHYSVT